LRAGQTLRLLAAFRALGRAQLEAFLFADERLTAASRRVVVHRILRQLRERGLVQAFVKPGPAATGGGSRAYVLTPAGQRVYAADDPSYPRQIRTPSTVLLEHAIALADVAIAFRDAAARATDIAFSWESDWEAVARMGSAVVIPDALVTLERKGWRTRAFIEADRATEREGAFARKLRRYIEFYRSDAWRASFGAWPLILTVTTSDAHARSLCRLADRVTRSEGGTRITHAFRFASLDDLRMAGPLAPIWHVAARVDRCAIPELSAEDGPRTVGSPIASHVGHNEGARETRSSSECLGQGLAGPFGAPGRRIDSLPAGQPSEERNNNASRTEGRAR
jgi:hypothetical protein